MTDEKCTNCYFGNPSVDGVVRCRRYPKNERKTSNDWCGEFVPKSCAENKTNKRRNRAVKAVPEESEEEHAEVS
jgi:hypothetical protein